MVTMSEWELRRQQARKTSLSKLPPLVIIHDTREQRPYNFAGIPKVAATLDVGDYTIQGMEDVVRVERKSFSDLLSSLGRNSEKFLARMDKLGDIRWKALLVEAHRFQIFYPPLGKYWKLWVNPPEEWKLPCGWPYGARHADGTFLSWNELIAVFKRSGTFTEVHPSSIKGAYLSVETRNILVEPAGNREAAEWWLTEYFRKLWAHHWEKCHEVVNGQALG